MRKQLGYAMVEALLVCGLALFVLLAVLGIHRLTQARADLGVMTAGTRTLIDQVEHGWGISQSYRGMNLAAVQAKGLVPPELVGTGWGTLDVVGRGPDWQSFVVSFSSIPAEDCASFVLAMAPGLREVRVAGTTLAAGRSPDVPGITRACAEGGSVALVRREPGYGIKAGWETW